MKKLTTVTMSSLIAASMILPLSVGTVSAQGTTVATKSPIKHVVVIFQENRSFDNYFGTYPTAPGFHSLPNTPAVNGIPAGSYNLDENGNKVAPYHFTNNDQTLDVNHGFDDMVKAYDNGKMDQFYAMSEKHTKGSGVIAMGYYDYNQLPAYWQYAQHFALADNWFQPVFGPSTPGALYLVAAQSGTKDQQIKGDPTPKNNFGGDKSAGLNYNLTYKNIGDELTASNIPWGWYQGGYAAKDDSYSSHHNPFQYFQNYEDGKYNNNLKDYNDLASDIDKGQLPAVTYVKAAYGEDEHPGTGNQSTPAAEDFSVKTINKIMTSQYWKDTAVIVTYDESGGYWDHVAPPQVDAGPDGLQGDGPRVPALVISPYAKKNYVSHVQYDTTSILKFIEWNFGVAALNNRDANASNILDMFDFNHPDFSAYVYSDTNTNLTNPYGKAAQVKVNNAWLASANSDAGAFVNDKQTVMVPLVDLARNINASIEYDKVTKMINVVYNGTVYQFPTNDNFAVVGGEKIKLSSKIWSSPKSHTYISLQDLASVLKTQTVTENGVTTILAE